MKHEHNCPGCGRRLILDEEKGESHHEAPMCDWFETLLKASASPPTFIGVHYEGADGKLYPLKGGTS